MEWYTENHDSKNCVHLYGKHIGFWNIDVLPSLISMSDMYSYSEKHIVLDIVMYCPHASSKLESTLCLNCVLSCVVNRINPADR